MMEILRVFSKIIFLFIFICFKANSQNQNKLELESGYTLYVRSCFACHSINEDRVGPALGKAVEKISNTQLFYYLQNPDSMIQNDPYFKGKIRNSAIPHIKYTEISKYEANAILEYVKNSVSSEAKSSPITEFPFNERSSLEMLSLDNRSLGKGSLQIGKARYIFTIDSVMTLGTASIADLYLSCSEKKLQNAVPRGLRATNASMVLGKDTAIIGKYVDADLIPSNPENFSIVEQYETNGRLVDSSSLITWSWSIIPRKESKSETFYLILYYSDNPFEDLRNIGSEINREFYRVKVKSKKQPLDVIIRFVTQEWKWFASSIIIPLFLFWYNRRRSTVKN